MANDNTLLILPHQLSIPKDEIKKHKYVYLVEEPIFFYDPIYKPLKPNKIKLAFLRASMKAFQKQCNVKSDKVVYIDYNKYDAFVEKLQHAQGTITLYDPIDHEVLRKYNRHYGANRLRIMPSTDLLIDVDTLKKKYFDKHEKTQRHASFYSFIKKELDILIDVKNLDKENRSPPPKQPPLVYNYKPKPHDMKVYQEAIDYVNVNFASHVGNPENVVFFPITHSGAKHNLQSFLVNAFTNFGKYEDAVMLEDPFMYHSVISPLLNNGLLNPRDVVNETLKYYKNNKTIPLASLEGFIRQIVGWRCMMQSMYIFKNPELIASNAPHNQYTFKDWTPWLTGNTGILPLDEEIKKACQYGYSHHIVRLMIFMNFFILCELHPHVIYKWFMEVVSMDAYSWVMISNIYAMGYFYPKLMTKPYLSTSNYIIKMTNYKKNGHWEKIWDALYHDFLRKKPSTYTFFYKRTFKDDSSMKALAEEFKSRHFTVLQL